MVYKLSQIIRLRFVPNITAAMFKLFPNILAPRCHDIYFVRYIYVILNIFPSEPLFLHYRGVLGLRESSFLTIRRKAIFRVETYPRFSVNKALTSLTFRNSRVII